MKHKEGTFQVIKFLAKAQLKVTSIPNSERQRYEIPGDYEAQFES